MGSSGNGKSSGSSTKTRQLVGRIVAKSHCLFTKPQSFLLQVRIGHGLQNLLINEKEQLRWNIYLVIGQTYCFTDLCRCLISVKEKKFCCWKATRNTKWKLSKEQGVYSLSESVSPQNSTSDAPLHSYSGTVTHVDPLVGLLTLNDGVDIIIAYQLPCSHLPQLCKGQKVKFHNLHKMQITLGKSLGVMCTRGFVEIISDVEQLSGEQSVLGTNIQSPLVKYAEDLNLGVEGLLWMHEEARRELSSFPPSFFYEHGLPREEADQCKENILKATIYFTMDGSLNCNSSRTMLGEFIRSEHTCLPMTAFFPVPHSVSPTSCQVNHPTMDEEPSLIPLPPMTRVRSWKKKTQHTKSYVMVGLLKPAESSTYYKEALFHLVDGNSHIPCVLSKERKVVKPSGCPELCNAMVMTKKYVLVQQKLELESVEEPVCLQFVQIDVSDVKKICQLGSTTQVMGQVLRTNDEISSGKDRN